MQLDMVDEMLQKSEFSLYVLHLCYIKFHFDYMFHIYVIQSFILITYFIFTLYVLSYIYIKFYFNYIFHIYFMFY